MIHQPAGRPNINININIDININININIITSLSPGPPPGLFFPLPNLYIPYKEETATTPGLHAALPSLQPIHSLQRRDSSDSGSARWRPLAKPGVSLL